MAQRNNHARRKNKIKMFRLKAFWKRVFGKRAEKQAKAKKPKGKTFVGEGGAKLFASLNRQYKDAAGPWKESQRKRRKLHRQNPHLRNK